MCVDVSFTMHRAAVSVISIEVSRCQMIRAVA
jgi:hypothetical protein